MDDQVTEDGFLGGRLRIRQPRHGYRAGGDPVLLAAAVLPVAGQHVLDLGCGVGTLSLCLAARVPDISVLGIDIQAELVDLANQNAALNQLDGRCRFKAGDVNQLRHLVAGQRFQGVVTNPPWMESGTATLPPNRVKATGHTESAVDLDRWIKLAANAVDPKGWVAVIHRADRLHDLFAAFALAKIGDVRVIGLYPQADKPANRVILIGRKGIKSPTQLLPPVIVHDETGGYTPAVKAVLEQGAALTNVSAGRSDGL